MAAPIVGRQEKTILFDVSKRELFTPNQGLKGLRRKLGSQFTIAVNKDAITLAVLREASVFAIVGPREKFSAAEFEAMNEYMKEGGSIFITLGEEGESKFATNVNYFCEEYGIAFNQDAVVRTVYYKYLHPKEVHIANGVLNREINVASGRRPRAASAATGALVPPAISESSPQANLSFVYPYGCSLAVQKPAFPVLSSGPLAFPLNRPVCALWSGERARSGAVSGASGGGRLCVLGSSYVLQDDWVDKEENGKLVNVLLRWLTHDGGVTMDSIDADDPDVAEYHQLPDSEALAERVRCCLEETEEFDSQHASAHHGDLPFPTGALLSRRDRGGHEGLHDALRRLAVQVRHLSHPGGCEALRDPRRQARAPLAHPAAV